MAIVAFRPINASSIYDRDISHLRPSKSSILRASPRTKHIKFQELISFIYYELDQPVAPNRNIILEGLNYDFRQVNSSAEDIVCKLESLEKTSLDFDGDTVRLEGQVIVKNVSYEKQVSIRYSLSNWKTFSDLPAFFFNSQEDSNFDRFMFIIKVDREFLMSQDSITIHLAVKYEVAGQVYWDNNSSLNYSFKLFVEK